MTQKKPVGIKPGQYLGGIRTIEDVKMRCKIDEDSDCWIWRMGKTGGKYPKISIRVNGAHTSSTGIRVAVMLAGRDVPEGMTAYHYRCTRTDCLNPEHIRVGTHKEKWAHIKASGHMRGNPTRTTANKAQALKRAKVMPFVDLIMESDKSAEELARETGLDPSTVRAVRNGLRGKTLVNGASVFAWRPAA